MSEPTIILNVTNHERAVKTSKSPEKASDRDIRHAIRYFTEDRRANKRSIKQSKSLNEYYKSEGYPTDWNDIKISGHKSNVEKNNVIIRALKNELSRRNNR